MNKSSQISTRRAIAAIVLAILVLVAAQLIALFVGNGITAIGEYDALGNTIAAVLYPSLTVFGLKLLCDKILKISLAECGITKCKIKPIGILFSLITYESGNIWSSAFMHSTWNMCMASGILYIRQEMSENSIFNYVLDSDSFLISGGDFGVEASVISISAYLAFIILAIKRYFAPN